MKDIAKVAVTDPDAAPLDLDWTKARLITPPGKDTITLRLHQDVLDWFKKRGRDVRPASMLPCAPSAKARIMTPQTSTRVERKRGDGLHLTWAAIWPGPPRPYSFYQPATVRPGPTS